jgi:hypothetical protein
MIHKERAQAFLLELTQLSRKHGLAVALYVSPEGFGASAPHLVDLTDSAGAHRPDGWYGLTVDEGRAFFGWMTPTPPQASLQ